MTDYLNVGDVVSLRSGGPSMTVVSSDAGCKVVDVAWFADGEMRHSQVPARSLSLERRAPIVTAVGKSTSAIAAVLESH